MKQHMIEVTEKKLQFLRTHISGLRLMTEVQATSCANFFKPLTFLRHQTFFKKGYAGNGTIYIVQEGSIELHGWEDGGSSPSSMQADSLSPSKVICGKTASALSWAKLDMRRLVELVQGGIFASADGKSLETMTAVATTTSVVLAIQKESLKLVPDVVSRSLRDVLESLAGWRQQRLVPCQNLEWNVNNGPMSRTRPASGMGRMPSLSGKRPSSRAQTPSSRPCTAVQLPMMRPNTRCGTNAHQSYRQLSSSVIDKSVSMPSLHNFQEFNMEPGELLATHALKPSIRQQPRRCMSRQMGRSLPALPTCVEA
jgi:CRP-like cAMP-binding protein